MEDLKVLQEMEWNGIKYDLEKSIRLGEGLKAEETEITNRLSQLVTAPFDINWNSGDHLSAILYGGTVTYVVKEPLGVYKTGAKAGQPRYRNLPTEHTFQRLVEPLKGSELAKEGYWSTAEDVLKELHPTGIAKEIIESIQKQTKINKLRTTYYEGIPKRFEEFGWDDGCVHGQLNQCVARTGRLSSSNPNLQNNDKNVKECFISRYE
jgi:DNA polymerase I-like protein with 3'-5' exonuclease and polymerase domains